MNPSRRDLFRYFSAGALASLVSERLVREARADAPPAKSKSLVVLWMNGGQSHIDTWDPKPGTAEGGPHKAIKTATAGLSISEHMPAIAKMSQKICVVRSLTHKEGNHQRANALLHTSYSPSPTVDHPSLGGWMAKRFGPPAGGLPAFVSLGGPSHSAGFFGVQYGPFVLAKAGALPQNVTHPSGIDERRFDDRLKLLDAIEGDFAKRTGDVKVEGRRSLTTQAVGLMRAKDLPAFDLTNVPKATQDAFGDTDFGRACLVASRLVGAGTRYVEVALDGWDTHIDNFGRTKKLMGTLDAAFSALVKELDQRRLLASTTIALMTDFGRTPRINANDGRDHHPASSSVVLAGAGIRTNQVYGETDAQGAKVTKGALTVPGLVATLATVLGLDPADAAISPAGRPIALADGGQPLRDLLA